MDRRKIIHIDMDAFFTSVEQLDFPELRGKPVVVGGRSKRAVVAAASYEARKFGIHSAMPMYKALQLCDHLIVQQHRFDRYIGLSKLIRQIFFRYTDLVEPLSIDEAYLDITNNKLDDPSAKSIAIAIKTEIGRETGLTCSAGISINKFLAKMASDLRKPDGLSIIHPDKIEQFIQTLPIEKFYGIGGKTAMKMKAMNIHTGKDLQEISRLRLIKLFGKAGNYYYQVARGIDSRPVNPIRERKSFSLERTLEENVRSVQEMKIKLNQLGEKLWRNLAEKHLNGRTLTIKIKFADFNTITRSRTKPGGYQSLEQIEKCIREILQEIPEPFEIRLLGIGMSNFIDDDEAQQFSLTFD